MKKTFTMSKILAERLAKLAKEQETTQSMIVETSLTIFMMINYGAPLQAHQLSDMIPKNQIDLFEELDRMDKRKTK